MRLLRLFILAATLVFLTGTVSAQAPVKAPVKAADKVAKAVTGKAADNAAPLIDINSASAAELKAIPGIGDAYSAAIIKGRPFANKAQLTNRGILPVGVYAKIKDKIIAKQ